MNAAAIEIDTAAEDGDPGFGLYVHWPFCRSLCPYCDFNSHVRAAIDEPRWRRALLAEMAHFATLSRGRRLTSLFFGGGTPSLMAPATTAAVIDAAARHWPPAGALEITLEANPTSAEAGRFAGYRAAGVTRISLGVQALDDRALAFLGRRHSAREALAAVEMARRQVPRVSFDLIYARPGQEPAAWAAELTQALAQAPEHLALYQLTIEPGTRFHADWRRGDLLPPDAETGGALYETTQEMLEAAGLPAYEISNHARPGAECRHNLTYWRGGDYLGIGPGAHGRLRQGGQRLALRQHRAPEAWLAAVERDGHATRSQQVLSPEDRLIEFVMMGLRLREGVSRAAFRRDLGTEMERLLDGRRLSALQEEGLIGIDDRGLRATPAGRQRLNALLGYLLSDARLAS